MKQAVYGLRVARFLCCAWRHYYYSSYPIRLERSSLQNHSMLQLSVCYILAVQFRTHSVGEQEVKVI